MAQKLVEANGVRLCVETFGNPADPRVLLIMGAMASMVSWPDSFCRALGDGGRYVVRYDNRDVGRSVTYEPGSPPYGLVACAPRRRRTGRRGRNLGGTNRAG